MLFNPPRSVDKFKAEALKLYLSCVSREFVCAIEGLQLRWQSCLRVVFVQTVLISL